jgi:hypothetical protein
MIMLLVVGGPIVALLIALAPDPRRPLNTQVATNTIRDGAEVNEPPTTKPDGIAQRERISEPDQRSDEKIQQLALRATLAEEAQARWAKWQGVAGIIGLFAALGILLYTHFTLSATATAATAALKTPQPLKRISMRLIGRGSINECRSEGRCLLPRMETLLFPFRLQ